MRVALVHYWLIGMRGGEKVLEALCRMYPDADIFTLFYDPAKVSDTIRRHRVQASWLNPARRLHRSLLPLAPMALESFDLRAYDLVISSESGPAKGVITHSDSCHICYCHTPMRYLWDLYPAYCREWTRSRLKRFAMIPLTHYLRLWDFASAARVDAFAANSENVRRRIAHLWRRDACVIYPPVDTARFFWQQPEDYFLMVAEMVAYKQLAYAVRTFTASGRKLRIVGGGPEYRNLRAMAGPSIEFCGRVPDAELSTLYSRARALVVPGEEDFGIATVEALASGKPVIGLRRGGTPEILPVEMPAGVLYERADEAALRDALEEFDAVEPHLEPAALQAWAERFSEPAFRRDMQSLIQRSLASQLRGIDVCAAIAPEFAQVPPLRR
ncbi:MAG TPA: glycosyltransferase [Bryobacteraceae bacterium]|jgi:glycosyltransferase involved in cell wall biosynthesis|nr:glycosyltransferase [Bryobacteraceae bacterium]